MFCSKCGNSIPDDVAFCPACGEKLKSFDSESTVRANDNFRQYNQQQYNQQQYGQQQYGQQQYGQMPIMTLKTNRSLVKYILLSAITFGIYGLVVMSNVSTDINVIASRYDGKKTMHYCLVYFIFSWLTCGIVPIVWCHKISNRIGKELDRRYLNYDFSASDFWIWSVLGSIIIVGPFIYFHKFFKSMNLLCEDYNRKG